MNDHERPSAFQMFIRRAAATRPLAWICARILHHVDALVFRLTDGRTTFSTWISGFVIVMLTTTGARTGRRRALPVVGLLDGPDVIVIASNFGRPRHPAWYHNLRANPQATVAFAGVTMQVTAHELTGPERDLWYERGIAMNPGWVLYRQRAAHRLIPVLRLESVSATAAGSDARSSTPTGAHPA
ncbi:MAG TPA: nitroreductase family deazaflavin-dependent oxidoreductase [Euzebyales bacterium]|nr:nitroreductase family deazaflavin-dependent oxidoreductase [Euzebyales bacterium]